MTWPWGVGCGEGTEEEAALVSSSHKMNIYKVWLGFFLKQDCSCGGALWA